MPTIYSASHDNHENINSWVFSTFLHTAVSMGLCFAALQDAGAPLYMKILLFKTIKLIPKKVMATSGVSIPPPTQYHPSFPSFPTLKDENEFV